ncbi:ArsC/Spx/MgsR family protein [Bacillus sp. EB600]|uniref:ArsC/Spx/MgsR family protein n=1 Tax=Bacillus sp. EB600 TaxID=2806345 RepID=UPI0035C16F56
MKDLYSLIQKKPGILKRLIIHDGKRIMVGYDEHQIGRFLPRTVRRDHYMELIKNIQ